jgi:hypothetical protein
MRSLAFETGDSKLREAANIRWLWLLISRIEAWTTRKGRIVARESAG